MSDAARGVTGLVAKLVFTCAAALAFVSPVRAEFAVPPTEAVWDINKHIQVSALLDESDHCFHNGDYDGSIQLLRKVIDLDPGHVEAYELVNWLLDSTNRKIEGIDILVLNTLANPKSWESHFELGLQYYYLGDFMAAVNRFSKASDLSDSVLPLRMLAHAYEHAGDNSKAIACFGKIAGRDPSDVGAVMNMVRILNRVPTNADPTRLWHRPD